MSTSVISIQTSPIEVINIGGEFMTIFLIISLIISLLLVESRYWNRLVSDTLNTCYNSLFLVFIAIVIFRIMLMNWRL